MSPRIDFDPDGVHNDLPTYPWGRVPGHLATRRQLRAKGLSPGGSPRVAQSRRPRSRVIAYFYEIDTARPIRPMSAAKAAAVGKALAARRWCPQCESDAGYCLRKVWGVCNACAEALGLTR